MTNRFRKNTGISPAVGVILLIGLSVATATLAGIVLLDIGERGLNDSVNAGVGVEETPEGVEVSWNQQGNAEQIKVKVDGETVSTLGSVNDSIKLGVDEDKNISVVGVSDGGATEQLIKETTTEADTNPTGGSEYTVKDQDIEGETVTGSVRLNPSIEGASVTVVDSSGAVISSTTTDSEGNFSTKGSVGDTLKVIVNGDIRYNGNNVYASKKLTLSSTSVTIDFEESKLIDIGGGRSVIDNNSIGSVVELRGIPDNSSETYEIISDIDASGTSSWNSGKGFRPISGFSGTLDGNNHTVSGLSISRANTDQIGVFSKVDSGGVVKNIRFNNASISGAMKTSVVVGALQGGVIENVTVFNSEISGNSAGTVVGEAEDSAIKESSSIRNSVGGALRGGGLAGRLSDSELRKSYTTKLTLERKGGLLVGSASYSTISESYGERLVGQFNENGTDVGGAQLVGSSSSTTMANVFNTSSGITNEIETIDDAYHVRFKYNDAGTQLAKYQMVEGTAEEKMKGFDFESVWKTPNGDRYPTLRDNPKPEEYSEIEINESLYQCKDVSYSTTESGQLEIDSMLKLQCMDYKSSDTSYILTKDLDASTFSDFKPIKDKGNFSGTLDGNGHTISNLSITGDNGPDFKTTHLGLMYRVSNGTVKNITFENASITGNEHSIGVVTGKFKNNSLAENITVSNSDIKSGNHVGAITGKVQNSTLTLSSSIDNSIESVFSSGGLTGQIEDGTLSKSYTLGLSVNERGAAFVENSENSTISNSYARGSNVSYLVGDGSVISATVENLYHVNGGISEDGNTTTYYDSSKTSNTSNGVGLTTSEMQGSSASSNMSNFDFSNVWTTQSDGYPILRDNSE